MQFKKPPVEQIFYLFDFVKQGFQGLSENHFVRKLPEIKY